MRTSSLFGALIAVVLGTQLACVCPVFAQTEGDNQFLLLYFNEEDLYVESSTRGRKSITRTAENMTIITARDIELMKAHTLAEVLSTVPGVQMFNTGGPGSIASASIQGSENRHVAVFLDGIPLHNLSDNTADVGPVPVQNIERIEIVKGPASSAWGSALGGVINIITKAGGDEASGLLSASQGTADTGDFRAEVSGKVDRLGYYLTAGRLKTDGFRPRNDFFGNNAFGKISFDITNSTKVQVSSGYERFDRGVIDLPIFDVFVENRNKAMRSAFSVESSLNRGTTARLTLWRLEQQYDYYNYQSSNGSFMSRDTYEDRGTGASLQLGWKHAGHDLVAGTDLDSRRLTASTLAGEEHFQRKYAFYLNDTITISRFSLTPGVRYDRIDLNGTMTSPSLGMTYKPTGDLLLRAYGARGFSIPTLGAVFGDNLFNAPNPALKTERVRSYQAGAETTAIPFLWMKAGVFRHDISDMLSNIIVPGPQGMMVNGGKARRQGLEVEVRTKPLYHTSLTAGGAFMNTRDASTGRTVPNTPQRTYDVGLRYDDGSFNLLAAGHYIYWNSDPANEGKYKAMIFDVSAAKTIYAGPQVSFETFGKVHNIADGAQYPIVFYKNPGRWYEAGIRTMF